MLLHKNENPLVSICIPAYNAEKTIVATLQSILTQTYQNLEIIIVDNASQDNTLVILQQFNDPRVKIYKNNINIGAENNFSRCIELATGDYIAIFHADDVYMPDMVKKQVQAFQNNPSIGAVFTLADRINYNDDIIGSYKLPDELKDSNTHSFYEIFISILKNGNFLICPSAMVRSEIYKQLSPFNGERFKTSSDLDMWLRISKKYQIAILNEKLMSYRIVDSHSGAVHNYQHTDEADFFKVMDFHLSTENHNVKNIPHDILNIYELHRYGDNVMRAMNYINRGQPKDARKLLKDSLSIKVFTVTLSNIKKPIFLALLVLGVIFLVLTYSKLEKYPYKILHWLRLRHRSKMIKDKRYFCHE